LKYTGQERPLSQTHRASADVLYVGVKLNYWQQNFWCLFYAVARICRQTIRRRDEMSCPFSRKRWWPSLVTN